MTSDVSTLQTIINHAHRLVFFGGAGVSTESVFPTFAAKTDCITKSMTFRRKPFSATRISFGTPRHFIAFIGTR